MSAAVLDPALDMARAGRLYPALILHGASAETRRLAAAELGRTLLCERPEAERPCGECRTCRRIELLDEPAHFHPDFHRLEQDQKTVTSIEATRRFLEAAQMAPYEARGQVFVIAAAETLGAEASDTLLKILEEPPPRTPRHFLLLAPSASELPATLRSRSMSLFLGAEEAIDAERREALATALVEPLERFAATGSSVYLLSTAGLLQKAGSWDDLRASEPWSLAAAAVVECAGRESFDPALRRSLLDLAAALLEARSQRLRGILPQRILEGLLVRHLAGVSGPLAGR